MKDRIFINYRHGEASSMFAGLIYSKLLEKYDAQQIFKDRSNLEPGDDYIKRINQVIGDSQVFLVLITSTWGREKYEDETSRIFSPNDFVRMEIAAAIEQKCPIIPVMHADAVMPTAEQLPAELHPVIRLHAVSINPQRIEFDIEKLYMAIDSKLSANMESENVLTENESAKKSPVVGILLFIVALVIIYVVIASNTNIF